MNRTGIHMRITDWIIIVVFACVLFVPLCLSIIQPDLTFSKTEKRPLAELPQIADLDETTTFPRHFDAYYQDHFGLREWLIHRYQREMGKRFGLSGVSYVVEGSDGWLFFAGEEVLDDLQGQLQFSDNELRRFRRNIMAKRNWLARRNIQYIPLVAANKQSIYPEHLPEYYRLAKKQTRLDHLLASCNRDVETMILDLRPALIGSKAKGRLYDRTDTHWNYLGAHVAYLEIMGRVQKHFPDFVYRRQFSFDADWKSFVGGDLALMLGRRDSLRETRPVPRQKQFTSRAKPLPVELSELLSLEQFEPELRERSGTGLRLLVLHDSFFNHLKPFVSENFAEILYIWKYYDEASMNALNQDVLHRVLQEFKPDLVIDEVVERHLPFLFRHDKPGNKD